MNSLSISKLVLFLLSLCCLLSADITYSETRVRVKNDSGYDFQNVRVNFKGQVENYGPLSSGKASDYRRISLAYRYAYIEVVVAGGQYKLQPKDYVGETPLEAGWFTYKLNFDPAHKTVDLHLIKEDPLK